MKEILPFVTTWMDLEGIMFSEISQRNTNAVCSHLNVESKQKQKNKLIDTEKRLMVARGGVGEWEMDKIGEQGQKVQTSSCKINVMGM